MTERLFSPSKNSTVLTAVYTGLLSIQVSYYAVLTQAYIFWIILTPIFLIFIFHLVILNKKWTSLQLKNDGIYYELWEKSISSNFASWEVIEHATKLYRFKMGLIAIQVNQSVPLSRSHKIMYGNRLIIYGDSLKGKNSEICDEINRLIDDKNRHLNS